RRELWHRPDQCISKHWKTNSQKRGLPALDRPKLQANRRVVSRPCLRRNPGKHSGKALQSLEPRYEGIPTGNPSEPCPTLCGICPVSSQGFYSAGQNLPLLRSEPRTVFHLMFPDLLQGADELPCEQM